MVVGCTRASSPRSATSTSLRQKRHPSSVRQVGAQTTGSVWVAVPSLEVPGAVGLDLAGGREGLRLSDHAWSQSHGACRTAELKRVAEDSGSTGAYAQATIVE